MTTALAFISIFAVLTTLWIASRRASSSFALANNVAYVSHEASNISPYGSTNLTPLSWKTLQFNRSKGVYLCRIVGCSNHDPNDLTSFWFGPQCSEESCTIQTESRISALYNQWVDSYLQGLLGVKTCCSISICDLRLFGMLFVSKQNRLIELGERRHLNKYIVTQVMSTTADEKSWRYEKKEGSLMNVSVRNERAGRFEEKQILNM